jgi:hypothetical protein
MMLPLPPEPPPLEAAPLEDGGSAERAKVFFCDSCDASIPTSDWQLGNAKEFDGKNYCKDCIAKGVVVGTPLPKRPRLGSASKTKSVDEILAGLNDEAIVVDTTIKRRGVAVADAQLAESKATFERATSGNQAAVSAPSASKAPVSAEPRPAKPPVPARAAPVPPAKPAASPGPASAELGDEFEEIG